VIKNALSCEDWKFLGKEREQAQQVITKYDARHIFVAKTFLDDLNSST
jgi:hypothetical protein